MDYLNFEDLQVWQLSKKLVSEVYTITEHPTFSKDFALKDQIKRSSVTLLSNISQGFERKSNREFIWFLNIAKGTAGELRAKLHVAHDMNYLSELKFNHLLHYTKSISQSLTGLINGLSDSPYLNGIEDEGINY